MDYNQKDILLLLEEKMKLDRRLNSIPYGSIETRKSNGKEYIYVHYREDGILLSKYIGPYSEDTASLILSNNVEAKDIKKRIRHINKKLNEANYIEKQVDEKVMINIDYAKRNLVDSIYKQAVLEGVTATYADTETIIEGGKVNNMSSEDVLKVLNLKHAWDFILNKEVVASPSNFALLSDINRFVLEGFYYNAGKVRSVPVNIGGTDWKPELPIETIVKERLSSLLESSMNFQDIAIESLLYVMKSQIFIDGNKRTALIFANHVLISHGIGLIVISDKLISEYKRLLILYYEGIDEKSIRDFIKQKCYVKI
jgi:Fic family protein